MKTCIAIVRHGDYVGGGDFQDPLSEHGRNQMRSVREVITEHFRNIYGTNRDGETNVERLAISFSSAKRALESTAILKFREDMVVTELYLTERNEIDEPEKIVRKVLALLAYYGANACTIVAHGDMPAVFAETLIKIAGGEVKSLRSPAKGNGFLVNMATGEVFMVSPEKPKEEVKQPPVVRKPVPEAPTQRTATQPRRQAPATPLFDDMDDDIPF